MMGNNRKFCRSLLAVPAVLGFGLVTPTPAYALLSIIGAPSAAVAVGSLLGTAVVGGAVIAGVTFGPTTVAVGATLFVLVDPVDATFYNGSFQAFFPTDLLSPGVSGWLGDWGLNPATPEPPVGTSPLPAFDIQAPNSALTASVTNDLINGLQTVTFDWGPLGHAEIGSGEFNFYAAAFHAQRDLLITNLGAGAGPRPGANLFVAGLGISCSAPGSTVVNNQCGSPVTSNHSFLVQAVPEPATWLTFLTGFGTLAGLMRRGTWRQRSQPASGADRRLR